MYLYINTQKEKEMAKIISFANQKGGVGKTTSAVNVAASLGLLGHRVLIADLDPQGNTTSGLGIAKKQLKVTTKDVLTGEVSAKDALIETEFNNLWLIPTNISLATAEYELYDLFENDELPYRMRKVLGELQDDFDYIIIDCPPSLGTLTINAFTASDSIIVPMQCEYYALEGLSQLMISIKGIKKRYNPDLTVSGILITMYNQRLLLSQQVMSELRKHYADKLLTPPISRSVKVSEAPGFGMPVYYHDKRNKGATEYLDCAKDLASRI